MTSDEFTEQLDENLRKWFKEKWVRFGPDGKIRGACARGDDSEGKPKCLPQKKAQNLGKKGRKYAASKKRREDPNPERTGKAKNVATKKKTNEGVPFDECPKCHGPIVHESMMNEKQDACYHKVKSRYKVWPSAYASGALVQCRKKGASNWGNSKKTESSIMKGLVNEEEYVLVLYVDGKPLAKYGADQEARKTMERLKAKFPNKTMELKREVRGGIGGNEKVGEAANPAQQAAIAISKKERGEKPKNEASGTPGGLERYRTPAMVNATMQQSLYKRELAPIKAAEKKRKEAEYRKNNPSVSVPSIQIGATNYPIPVIQSWIDNKDLNAALEFAVNKFAYKQSKDFKTELAGDPNFQKAIKNFFNVAEKSLNNRNSTRTKSRWDGKIRAAHRETDISSDGFDAVNKINDALLPYYKKYGVDKTGRRVPPGFNYNLEEAKAKPYVKPFIENGKQVGWKSSDGYHVKYWQMFAKDSAIKHAKISPDEVQEDYTGEFAAEKTPAINPYGGLKDNQFRGAISETPTDNPTGASGEGGTRRYRPKPAGEIEEDTSYAGGMGQGGNAGESYRKFKPKSAGTFKEDELDEACWKGYHKEGNKKMFGKTYPNCVKNTNEELDEGWKMGALGAAAGAMLGHIGLPADAAGMAQLAGMIAGGYFGKDINSLADLKDRFTKNPAEFKKLMSQRKKITKAKKIEKGIIKLNDTISNLDEVVNLIQNKHYKQAETMFDEIFGGGLIGYTTGDWRNLENDLSDISDREEWIGTEPEFKYLDKIYTAFSKRPIDYAEEFANALLKVKNYILSRIQEVQQDNKEQLDEKCWDTHKQVGMKKKGGKEVPNCVPKESAIMKGLKSL